MSDHPFTPQPGSGMCVCGDPRDTHRPVYCELCELLGYASIHAHAMYVVPMCGTANKWALCRICADETGACTVAVMP